MDDNGRPPTSTAHHEDVGHILPLLEQPGPDDEEDKFIQEELLKHSLALKLLEARRKQLQYAKKHQLQQQQLNEPQELPTSASNQGSRLYSSVSLPPIAP